MENKEIVKHDFTLMISASWTYARLTYKERQKLADIIEQAKVFGTYNQRWQQLNNLYSAFLAGCDYEPLGWRE